MREGVKGMIFLGTRLHIREGVKGMIFLVTENTRDSL